MIDFALLAHRAHTTSVEKGWYEKDREGHIILRRVAQVCGLFHSEISEALEELRRPDSDPRANPTSGIYFWNEATQHIIHDDVPSNYTDAPPICGTDLEGEWLFYKPEGAAVELADLIIRLADSAGAWDCAHLVHLTDVCSARVDRFRHIADLHAGVSRLYNFLHTRESSNKPLGDGIVAGEIQALVQESMAFCFSEGWALEKAIQVKMVYNDTRPARHGGKKA